MKARGTAEEYKAGDRLFHRYMYEKRDMLSTRYHGTTSKKIRAAN